MKLLVSMFFSSCDGSLVTHLTLTLNPSLDMSIFPNTKDMTRNMSKKFENLVVIFHQWQCSHLPDHSFNYPGPVS